MAGVITLAPELFKGVIIKVSEVDVITRMLKDNVFYDELGDPNMKKFYEYMLSFLILQESENNLPFSS
jgi:oligopeptidase B